MQLTEFGFPRRNDVSKNTPAELAIRQAMRAVEGAGAHPLLTEAVGLLDQARHRVADYVELAADGAPGNPAAPDTGEGLTPGTPVTLASGGPVMTVFEVGRYSGIVWCRWVDDGGEVRECVFPAAALRRAPRPPRG